MAATAQDVVGFWRNAGPAKWFAKSAAFDDAIRLRFEPVHHRAAAGAYDDWAREPEGSLALLLLLDQFPRNLYRGTAHAFATDGKALSIAKTAVAAGQDRHVEAALRPFFYLPFEHAEDLEAQEVSVALCQRLKDESGDAETLKWAEIHRDIIKRFGRFPHRNPMLGRESRPEELGFLAEGGFSG
jgi:uncharacterized protein (DUF924 family)